MPKLQFNREKYINLLKSQGVAAALTQLHHDTIRWEHQSYEGPEGYQPQLWEDLHDVRAFSRELWEIALQQESHR